MHDGTAAASQTGSAQLAVGFGLRAGGKAGSSLSRTTTTPLLLNYLQRGARRRRLRRGLGGLLGDDLLGRVVEERI